MTPQEYQARIDACFNTLPTPEEVVDWANQNDFKLEPGGVGNDKCGCALTAVVLMRYPNAYRDAELVTDIPLDSRDVFTEACHGELLGLSDDRTNIWRGFDGLMYSSSLRADQLKGSKQHTFGRTLRRLAGYN